MSEAVNDSSELKPETSPSNKRKRGVASDSPGERRTKRGAAIPTSSAAPAASMAGPDSINQAFLESTAAQAAANVDLSALQQANEAASHVDATDAVNASTTAAAALGSMYPAVQVPTTTNPAEQFAEGATNGQESSQDASFAAEVSPVAAQADTVNATAASISPPTGGDMMVTNGTSGSGQQQSRGDFQFRKPAVGTEEWHKLRKDNHKEVERRRRETINEGINELAKIVPNCEKNKGAILQQAVQYIQQLKGQASSNIEKWTLEKLLTEQAIAELTSTNEKIKEENERLSKELEDAKKRLKT